MFHVITKFFHKHCIDYKFVFFKTNDAKFLKVIIIFAPPYILTIQLLNMNKKYKYDTRIFSHAFLSYIHQFKH